MTKQYKKKKEVNYDYIDQLILNIIIIIINIILYMNRDSRISHKFYC